MSDDPLANFYVGEDGMGGIYLECDPCGRTVHVESREYSLASMVFDARQHECKPGQRLHL